MEKPNEEVLKSGFIGQVEDVVPYKPKELSISQQIKQMKEEGYTSAEVAKKLGLDLEYVNKKW